MCNCIKIWFWATGVIFALTSVTGISWARDDFVEEIPADFTGSWGEERVGSQWHRGQQCVGGLGFEVLTGDWPRLLQRGFLDAFQSHDRFDM